MEIQTISLALIVALSIPVVAAYWFFLRASKNSHLEVLLASDRNDANQISLMKIWKLHEKCKLGFAFAIIGLLLVWGAIQIALGPEAKSTVDTILSLAFALPLVTAIVASTHYDILDLLNSYGSGERAEIRLQEAYPAS